MDRSVSLVIETENLKGGGAARDEVASLERLLMQLGRQSFDIAALRELVITTEDETGDAERVRLERAAGRPIRFVGIAGDAGYYGSKDAGFDATTSDVVVFADSDCWPDSKWLELLTAPLLRGDAEVVAGRTAYRDDPLGAALTTIDFMYFASDGARTLGDGDSGRGTRNFYANNVAFSRALFARFRFGRDGGFYRGNCQVLGLRLHDADGKIHYAHEALTTHRLPDTMKEALKLRLLRGGDSVALAPHLARRVLPKGLGRLPAPLLSTAVLGGRLLFSLSSVNRQGLTKQAGARHVAVAAMITAASATDAIGAIARGFGLNRAPERVTLSYHGDADRLSA